MQSHQKGNQLTQEHKKCLVIAHYRVGLSIQANVCLLLKWIPYY